MKMYSDPKVFPSHFMGRLKPLLPYHKEAEGQVSLNIE